MSLVYMQVLNVKKVGAIFLDHFCSKVLDR